LFRCETAFQQKKKKKKQSMSFVLLLIAFVVVRGVDIDPGDLSALQTLLRDDW
jgi:hypothetical protein